MIKQYLSFTKNGINSGDMGVTHVSVSGGLFNESIGGNRNIIELQNGNTDRRYHKRLSLDPIEFDMNLLLKDGITDAEIDSVFEWLLNDYYEELYFETELDKIYYCMPTSQPKITHNGMNQGYITVQMRCYDGHLYSRLITRNFDFSLNVTEGMTFSLQNNGHVDIYPYMSFLAKESTVKIVNLTTNESFEFTGLTVGETITVDNEEEEIATNTPGEYRFENHNDIFLRIVKGVNQYRVYGKCTIEFKYRSKRIF